MSEYPEHDKMHAVKEKSQAIGEFLEWLQDTHKVTLCVMHSHSASCNGSRGLHCGLRDGDYVPFMFGGYERLMAEFFEIDLKKIDDEKSAMLSELRSASHAPK